MREHSVDDERYGGLGEPLVLPVGDTQRPVVPLLPSLQFSTPLYLHALLLRLRLLLVLLSSPNSPLPL